MLSLLTRASCAAFLLLPGAALAQSGSVGIGTTSPDAAAALEIRSTTQGLLLPRLTQAQRDAIAAPPGGLVIFQTDNTPGLYAYSGTAWVLLGADNLGNHTATQNLSLGTNALTGAGADLGTTVGLGVRADGGLNIGQNTNGNMAIGYGAGSTGSGGGGGNLLVGYLAGNSNSTGAFNLFAGSLAGRNNTSGSTNHFTGFGAGYLNTTGSQNQFDGAQAGLLNTTGVNNYYAGCRAGLTSTGSYNVGVGYQAGYDNGVGSFNTFVGYQAGPSSAGLTNATALGNNARVGQSNSLVLGGTGADAVQVGIGTPTPAATLHVAGSASSVLLEGLAGAGTRVVTADATGALATVTTSSLADNLGNHAATQNLTLNSTYNLLLRGSGDPNNGLGWYGAGKAWNGSTPDGPVLYGFGGGMLGSSVFGTLNTALTWLSSGNVGIGTTSPDRPLAVQAAAGGNGELLSLKNSSGTTKWHWNLAGGGLNLAETGVADARLFVAAGGNVGLGTSNPSFKLQVEGTFRSTLSNGTFSLYSFGPGSGIASGTVLLGGFDGASGYGPQLRFAGVGTGYLDVGQNSSGDFVVEGNDLPRLTVQNGGNVGIGTATPQSTLDVAGTVSVKTNIGLVGGSSSAPTVLGNTTATYFGLTPSSGANYYRLPDPTTYPGRVYVIRNNAGTNAVLVTPAGSSLFAGSSSGALSSYTLSASSSSKTVILFSDGGNWTVGKLD